jgi:hypothetical protein
MCCHLMTKLTQCFEYWVAIIDIHVFHIKFPLLLFVYMEYLPRIFRCFPFFIISVMSISSFAICMFCLTWGWSTPNCHCCYILLGPVSWNLVLKVYPVCLIYSGGQPKLSVGIYWFCYIHLLLVVLECFLFFLVLSKFWVLEFPWKSVLPVKTENAYDYK